VGFAIPVDIVRSSAEQIIAFGRVVRPILGISFAPEASVEQLGVSGVLVLDARAGGPAAKAGVRGTTRDEYGRLVLGDVIMGIGEIVGWGLGGRAVQGVVGRWLQLCMRCCTGAGRAWMRGPCSCAAPAHRPQR
jgi:S1-C subfamily serine protease